MSTQLHLATTLSNWTKTGHTQTEFANLSGLAPSGVSRMFKGELHPEVTTLAQIIRGIQPEYPQLARDIVEAYLLDHIPDTPAPDGRPWSSLIKIIIEELTSRLAEGAPISETDLAKHWLTSRIATPDGQRWLLTLYRWSNKGTTY
jgi:transcriptional regulator with XRE-family HTH domain